MGSWALGETQEKPCRSSAAAFPEAVRELSKAAKIQYNLMFAHQVLNDSGEQSDGTSL
jgi:hypothetical protein